MSYCLATSLASSCLRLLYRSLTLAPMPPQLALPRIVMAITTSSMAAKLGLQTAAWQTYTSVFARIEGQAGADGIAAFAINGHDGNIALEERLSVLPPHTVGTWTLTDCQVPSQRLIGELGQGFKIALHVLELFRPTVGAATLGFARRALTEAVEQSVKRNTFKKPISEHQLIQAKLADMAVGIDAAALPVYRTAWQHDATDRSIAREAAIAKLYSTETAFDIIDQAVQIFGGLGVIRGTTVERLFRHSRAFRIFDGTSEIQQLIIARSLLRHR
jgi:acyl-CoA dehydrogenase